MTYPILNPQLGVLALAIFLEFSQPAPLSAQRFKIPDVTIDDLKNTHYEKDSAADAVVLFDVVKGIVTGSPPNVGEQREIREHELTRGAEREMR